MAIARRPWAGQVAAALASVGVGVSLAAPAEVAASGEDASWHRRQTRAAARLGRMWRSWGKRPTASTIWPT